MKLHKYIRGYTFKFKPSGSQLLQVVHVAGARGKRGGVHKGEERRCTQECNILLYILLYRIRCHSQLLQVVHVPNLGGHLLQRVLIQTQTPVRVSVCARAPNFSACFERFEQDCICCTSSSAFSYRPRRLCGCGELQEMCAGQWQGVYCIWCSFTAAEGKQREARTAPHPQATHLQSFQPANSAPGSVLMRHLNRDTASMRVMAPSSGGSVST